MNLAQKTLIFILQCFVLLGKKEQTLVFLHEATDRWLHTHSSQFTMLPTFQKSKLLRVSKRKVSFIFVMIRRDGQHSLLADVSTVHDGTRIGAFCDNTTLCHGLSLCLAPCLSIFYCMPYINNPSSLPRFVDICQQFRHLWHLLPHYGLKG